MSDGTMTDTADGNVATGDLRIAFAALVEALHDNSLDAIVEVVGAPAEYNRGKAAMREWFMNRLRYFLATISAPGTPVVPPLSNAEAVVPASPSPPVGGGRSISAETCKPQSHARQEPVAQARETITTAAVRLGDLVLSMERPNRHHNIFWELDRLGAPRFAIPGQQGFVTSAGRFVDRSEGCAIARAAGQIIKKHGPGYELFSEDVWDGETLADPIVPPTPVAHGTEPSKPEAVMPAAQSWQPIETAPKDEDALFLGCIAGTKIATVTGYDANDGFYALNGVFKNWKPTHWQPLEAPPPVESVDHSLLADPMISTAQGVTEKAK